MEEKYKAQAEKILEEFSRRLEEMPEAEGGAGEIALVNVLREDAPPIKKNMYEEAIRIAPKKDSRGYYVAERVKL
ncbi:MAG: Asp-tRNA(Asn) amidotransferase GatCAB subunit C [Candidatus Geothermarchaeales archaeon]